ncbi:MAG: YbaK/EbsC family protein [Gammaproteobacteria bacterium]
MGSGELSRSAARVQQALDAAGCEFAVTEMPDSTRSAADAAAAIGCPVAAIAKSLVFRLEDRDLPVLVIARGADQVDVARLAAHLGEPVGRADADFVRKRTGFAIGGVPPLGHATPLRTIIDSAVLGEATVWAAAGTPNAVFGIPAARLVELTGGEVAEVRRKA